MDTCQFETHLEAYIPRVTCEEHGVVQVSVPWAEAGFRFTALFKSLVIDWLKEASFSAVARRLDLSWDEVDGIMSRAVDRGLAKREESAPTRIGLDETSFQKRHEYVTVVTDLDVTRVTAGNWRRRFAELGLDGLGDAPRSGAPRTVADDGGDCIIAKTLEAAPTRGTHWTTRTMAEATGLSQSTISRIWRAFTLRRHRTETFTISNDPFFVDKVCDIVGLYMDPPDKAIVLYVDEKSQGQALERTRPLLPMRPGVLECRTQDDVRHGTHLSSRHWTRRPGG